MSNEQAFRNRTAPEGLKERREHPTSSTTQDGNNHNNNNITTQQSQDVEANNNNNNNYNKAADTTKTNNQDGVIMTSNQNNNNDAISTDDNRPPESTTTTSVLLALQMANIMCWYWTNGMNGIAMQAHAGEVAQAAADSPKEASSRFFITLVITSTVTCLQLLLGALIGRLLLLGMNRKITLEQICSTRSVPLASLHAAGSLATNLGFMYGKASLVQVIKLLEPFETLLLSHMLFRREGNFSIGIISSMLLVVGAAMSLLKLQSTPPLPQAVIFAVLSGLTLSTRNVLQRKHHHTSVTTIAKRWTKLEKSVVQFTQLSLFSGLWMGAVSAVLRLLIYTPSVAHASWQVYVWHPLYNVFSMITLGFCSALTHSLLNAGKRVFAICMAMLWFAEGLNDVATLSGLLAVASGGVWYSWESKRKTAPPPQEAGGSSNNNNELYKLALSVSALVSLFAFHNVMTEAKA